MKWLKDALLCPSGCRAGAVSARLAAVPGLPNSIEIYAANESLFGLRSDALRLTLHSPHAGTGNAHVEGAASLLVLALVCALHRPVSDFSCTAPVLTATTTSAHLPVASSPSSSVMSDQRLPCNVTTVWTAVRPPKTVGVPWGADAFATSRHFPGALLAYSPRRPQADKKKCGTRPIQTFGSTSPTRRATRRCEIAKTARVRAQWTPS